MMGAEDVIAQEDEVKWRWQQGVVSRIRGRLWTGMKAEAGDQKEMALIALSEEAGQVSHV